MVLSLLRSLSVNVRAEILRHEIVGPLVKSYAVQVTETPTDDPEDPTAHLVLMQKRTLQLCAQLSLADETLSILSEFFSSFFAIARQSKDTETLLASLIVIGNLARGGETS